MIKNYLVLLLTVTFLWSAAIATHAGNLTKLAMDTKVKLLNDRLVVTMPKGSRIEARGHNIMGAPEPDESETRVVIESGKEKIVMMVSEAHALAGADLRKSVVALYAHIEKASKEKFEVMPADVSTGGLHYVRVAQKNAKPTAENAIPLATAIVSSKDGTAQFISFYANPDAAKDLPAATALTSNILKSLASGSRSLVRKSRTVQVSSLDGLSVTVPGDVATTSKRGPDFEVLSCTKLSELDKQKTNLGIYVGAHPSFHPDDKAVKHTDNILGQKIDWYEKSKAGLQHLDALVHVPGQSKDMLHLFASSPDAQGLEEMQKIARSLTVKKATKTP